MPSKRLVSHKSHAIEITTGIAGKQPEKMTIDGKNVAFLKHENGKYYTGLLPYSEFADLETMGKSLVEAHPSFTKSTQPKTSSKH